MFASCLELVRPTANHIQPACQPAHDPPAETRRAFSARRRRRALVAGNVARCRISTRVRFSTIPARVASLFAPILALTGPVTALGQAPKPADASAPVRELAPGTDQPVAPGGRPTHAIAMGCWTLAERWVRAFDAPDGAQAPAIDGAALTLRHDGRTVGRAAIMAPRDAPATDRERILARVVAAALADARRRLALPADYAGKWVILFSHPADFTPVCTSEFMTFASMQEEFAAYNTDLVGLSVDGLYSHIAWLRTIKEKIAFKGMRDVEVTFPLIEDISMEVARKYGMHVGAADTRLEHDADRRR